MLRRGVGVGAIANKSNVESMSKKLSEQRLDDIAKSVELLEDGIRSFIETHKEEIRNNEFLREKVKDLADTCGVDLGAATSATGRLKPGLLSSLLGDALLGGSDNSAAMKKFYDFLSSRVITVCMRERVLRGPVIPMSVVLHELRKRYPLEDITLMDVEKSIEHLKPLNPNCFVLDSSQQQNNSKGDEKLGHHHHGSSISAAEKDREGHCFIAFQPLSSSASKSSSKSKTIDASVGASDAIRILVLANELVRKRRKDLLEKLMLSSSAGTNALSTPSGGSKIGGFSGHRFSSPSTSSAPSKQQQQAALLSTPLAIELSQKIGILDNNSGGDHSTNSTSSSFYIRLTIQDVLDHLSDESSSQSQEQKSSKRKVWTKDRARLALRASRALCEGWWDAVDKSTWLLVVVA